MDDKEIKRMEKLLKNAADKEKNIGLDDFDTRLGKIEGQLRQKSPPEKKWAAAGATGVSGGNSLALSRNKIIVAAVIVCIVIALSVALPLVLSGGNSGPGGDGDLSTGNGGCNPDDLSEKTVTREDFYAGLDDARIYPISFSDYEPDEYRLIVTDDSTVKGGAVVISDAEDGRRMSVLLRFYDSTVELPDISYLGYDLTYMAGGTEIKYKLMQYTEDDGVGSWHYDAFAQHDDLSYYITYHTSKDDVTELFDSLFG